MAIIANANPSFVKELVPMGTHIAVCYSMVHIGTIKQLYLGEEKELNKVRITWELSHEKRIFNPEKGLQPMVISKEFTLSMHEKSTLRKFLEQWRGKGFSEDEIKGFDISKLVGVACFVSITHKEATNGNMYAEISGVSQLPKGMEAPDQINPSFIFSYDPFEAEKLNTLPDFLKEKIMSSKEYKEVIENDLPY